MSKRISIESHFVFLIPFYPKIFLKCVPTPNNKWVIMEGRQTFVKDIRQKGRDIKETKCEQIEICLETL